jgi:hypothetical protein
MSLADHRLQIRQLYKTGLLSPEHATAQLLRLDIDELARSRRLKAQAASDQANLPDGGGHVAA